MSVPVIRQPAWLALEALAPRFAAPREGAGPSHLMRDLFEQDPRRFDRYALDVGPLLVDFSKQCFDQPVMSALLDLAELSSILRSFNISPSDLAA